MPQTSMAVLARDPTTIPQATAGSERSVRAPELAIAAGVITILGAIILGGHVLQGLLVI
jgi:hypothetical protein